MRFVHTYMAWLPLAHLVVHLSLTTILFFRPLISFPTVLKSPYVLLLLTTLRLQESSKAYSEWVEVKALKDAAVRALDLLHPPSLPFGYKEFLDATTKARRSMMEDKDFQLVVGVGQALKKVDRTLLKEYAKWCTKGTSPKPQPGDPGFTGNEAKLPSPTFFPSFNVVQALWDAFEPAACDVHSAAYSQVRDTIYRTYPDMSYNTQLSVPLTSHHPTHLVIIPLL